MAREAECARLNHFLDLAIQGHGQVCFLAGQAGAGKSALAAEFERRAQASHPDLLLAHAMCDPQVGSATPYAPFRDALAGLASAAQDKPAASPIKHENAARTLKTVKVITDALIKFGPDLVQLVVPGGQIIAKVGEFIVDQTGWRDKLKKNINKKEEEKKSLLAPAATQEQVIEQYVNVLREVTKHAPLALILDDMHWADNASIDLFFRLCRRLEGTRLLIISAYRPEEISADRAGGAHPLEKALNEIRRQQGDVWLDLDQTSAASRRAFVDAYLDKEPNLLGEEFRAQLFQHTGGHALFTIELLRVFQEQGAIKKNAAGQWVLADEVRWDSLPARVEGVIEARLAALSGESRECLNAASVEGQTFTIEAVGRALGRDALGLAKLFGGELSKTHRLVKSQETIRIGSQRLSAYSFSHGLIQSYVYNALDMAERAYLHEALGNAMEALYGERCDEIAPQLARHFELADVPDKAQKYLAKAGEQAAQSYASDAALDYLGRALALTPPSDAAERYRLLAAQERMHDLRADRAMQAALLAELARMADGFAPQDPRRAEIHLRQAGMALDTAEFDAAIAISQNLIKTPNTDALTLVNAHLTLAYALFQKGELSAARETLAHGLALAQANVFTAKVSHALDMLGVIDWSEGAHNAAQEHLTRALEQAQQAGDARREWSVLNDLGLVAAAQREFGRAIEYYTRGRAIAKKIGDRTAEVRLVSNLGDAALEGGEIVQARTYLGQALALAVDVADKRSQLIAKLNLSEASLTVGDHDDAEAQASSALALAKNINFKRGQTSAYGYLAQIALARGNPGAAQALAGLAMEIATAIGSRQRLAVGRMTAARAALLGGLADEAANGFAECETTWGELGNAPRLAQARAGLAAARAAQGHSLAAAQKAGALADEILAEPRGALAESLPMWAWTLCAKTLLAAGSANAQRFIEAGFDELIRRADKITEPPTRISFLLNAPDNAAMQNLYRQMVAAAGQSG